jgi:hypothetical protein
MLDYYGNQALFHECQGIGRRNAVCGMGRAVCGVRRVGIMYYVLLAIDDVKKAKSTEFRVFCPFSPASFALRPL